MLRLNENSLKFLFILPTKIMVCDIKKVQLRYQRGE